MRLGIWRPAAWQTPTDALSRHRPDASQIAIARRRNLTGCEFSVADAAHLDAIASGAWDTVVIFGVLHHMPDWRSAIRECHRVLREGGELYAEEPSGKAIRQFDRVFRYGHHPDAGFSLAELEAAARGTGFQLERALRLGPVGWYRWRR